MRDSKHNFHPSGLDFRFSKKVKACKRYNIDDVKSVGYFPKCGQRKWLKKTDLLLQGRSALSHSLGNGCNVHRTRLRINCHDEMIAGHNITLKIVYTMMAWLLGRIARKGGGAWSRSIRSKLNHDHHHHQFNITWKEWMCEWMEWMERREERGEGEGTQFPRLQGNIVVTRGDNFHYYRSESFFHRKTSFDEFFHFPLSQIVTHNVFNLFSPFVKLLSRFLSFLDTTSFLSCCKDSLVSTVFEPFSISNYKF